MSPTRLLATLPVLLSLGSVIVAGGKLEWFSRTEPSLELDCVLTRVRVNPPTPLIAGSIASCDSDLFVLSIGSEYPSPVVGTRLSVLRAGRWIGMVQVSSTSPTIRGELLYLAESERILPGDSLTTALGHAP